MTFLNFWRHGYCYLIQEFSVSPEYNSIRFFSGSVMITNFLVRWSKTVIWKYVSLLNLFPYNDQVHRVACKIKQSEEIYVHAPEIIWINTKPFSPSCLNNHACAIKHRFDKNHQSDWSLVCFLFARYINFHKAACLSKS